MDITKRKKKDRRIFLNTVNNMLVKRRSRPHTSKIGAEELNRIAKMRTFSLNSISRTVAKTSLGR